MPQIVERMRTGTTGGDIVAAAALATRTFGGEDYIGFHTLMAIAPAYHMSQELPENRKALPILKVLFRNATRIQEQGGVTRKCCIRCRPPKCRRTRRRRGARKTASVAAQ